MDEVSDANVPPETDAGAGVCCPINYFPCLDGKEPLGGWAATEAECATHVAGGPGGSYDLEVDEHGCEVMIGRFGSTGSVCCGCSGDAGPPEP